MTRAWIMLMGISVVGLGCGGSGGSSDQDVAIAFAAVVGEADFVCGDTYENLGANNTQIKLTDFRFYVQDVALRNANGEWIPVELTQNDFQVEDVALLDFEDGCGEVGNPELNDAVVGKVPGGQYDGISFRMGIPVDLNHAEASTAPGALGVTSMFWNWRGGYKFLRIDSGNIKDNPTVWRMHLGSTGCEMGDKSTPPEQACANENRVYVELDSFDIERDAVVANFAALVEGVPLDENADDTPAGCMSALDDPDCAPIFKNLGLPFGDQPEGTQSFFSAE